MIKTYWILEVYWSGTELALDLKLDKDADLKYLEARRDLSSLISVDLTKLIELRELVNYLDKRKNVILQELRFPRSIEFGITKAISVVHAYKVRSLSIGSTLFRDYL